MLLAKFRRLSWTLSFAIVLGIATSVNAQSLSAQKGTYRGLTPTDESPIGMGEIEVTVDANKVKMRIATGLKIEEESFDLSNFVALSADEVKGLYRSGSPFVGRTVAFKPKDAAMPVLMFLKNPKVDKNDPGASEFGLVVKMGEMSEMLGPTLLYSPSQGDAFEKLAKKITEGGGTFPLLKNGGTNKIQTASLRKKILESFAKDTVIELSGSAKARIMSPRYVPVSGGATMKNAQ